jgi:hypothetical protein
MKFLIIQFSPVSILYESLSPRHGASSGCGWRRRSPDWGLVEGLKFLTVKNQLVAKYHTGKSCVAVQNGELDGSVASS